MPNPALEDAFDASVTVVRHLFTAPDSDFAVVVTTADDGESVTAAGPLGHLEEGTRARIAGQWADHPKYGPQVQATLGYELDPDDADGTRKYLLTIRGVGKTRAAALIERHGDDLFEAVDRDPEAAFGALPGMGAKGAARAADSWRERRALRELYLLLAPHGAGWLASQLHETHGPGAAGVVRAQPYLLTEEHGVGFVTADAIARANGVGSDSPARRRAAVVHLLREAERRGDTFMTESALRGRARELVGELQEQLLGELDGDGTVVRGDGTVALAAVYAMEERVARRLADLAAAEPALDPPSASGDAELSQEQRDAVAAAFGRALSVVTGGPGTGKTTLVRAIVERAAAAKVDLALCAPTGRAARRMEEATGHEAVTIHRLVEWLPGEGPLRSAGYPLECDLLVVDESSMLSLEVASMLFDAVSAGTHVVLIGDADQLPPVGAGKPFADLIDSGAVPVARLTHVFRQAARSLIVQAAHAINAGGQPRTRADEGELRDFFFIEQTGDAAVADQVVELAAERLPAHYGVDAIREVQVLSPVYRGAVGVDALNERLRARLNPRGDAMLDGPLRDGDKLVQTRNDYVTGLMNGQIVVVRGQDADGEELLVATDAGEELAVPAERTNSLRPAYAISVHRSQGCEMPVVVVPVHSGHGGMLSRNLLYTAVTRARTACVLVGQRGAVAKAVGRADAFRRNSRLAGLLGG